MLEDIAGWVANHKEFSTAIVGLFNLVISVVLFAWNRVHADNMVRRKEHPELVVNHLIAYNDMFEYHLENPTLVSTRARLNLAVTMNGRTEHFEEDDIPVEAQSGKNRMIGAYADWLLERPDIHKVEIRRRYHELALVAPFSKPPSIGVFAVLTAFYRPPLSGAKTIVSRFFFVGAARFGFSPDGQQTLLQKIEFYRTNRFKWYFLRPFKTRGLQ